MFTKNNEFYFYQALARGKYADLIALKNDRGYCRHSGAIKNIQGNIYEMEIFINEDAFFELLKKYSQLRLTGFVTVHKGKWDNSVEVFYSESGVSNFKTQKICQYDGHNDPFCTDCELMENYSGRDDYFGRISYTYPFKREWNQLFLIKINAVAMKFQSSDSVYFLL